MLSSLSVTKQPSLGMVILIIKLKYHFFQAVMYVLMLYNRLTTHNTCKVLLV